MMSFVAEYAAHIGAYEQAALQAAGLVRTILKEADLSADVIASRAKSPQSLRIKIFEKGYKRPRSRITDLVGVRIITHYRDEVDPFIDAISARLQVDERRSIDKRMELKPTQFGYRSVHLIVRLKGFDVNRPELTALKDLWFEVQVRSLLEHSWAAVEHEVQYKSKIQYPFEPRRQFAAIAGALELLDREFESLREVRDELIDRYKAEYEAGEGLGEVLDTARLIALLASTLGGPGWVRDDHGRRPLDFRFAPTALAALKAAGIAKGFVLLRALSGSKTRALVRRYARASGEPVAALPHLAVVCLAIASKKPTVFAEYFPDFAVDPVFLKALQR